MIEEMTKERAYGILGLPIDADFSTTSLAFRNAKRIHRSHRRVRVSSAYVFRLILSDPGCSNTKKIEKMGAYLSE